jgi:hypothetical protein
MFAASLLRPVVAVGQAAVQHGLPRTLGARGVKSKTLVKAAWPGWPKISKDGWWFARAMKDRMGTSYETKQAIAFRKGKAKGQRGRELQANVQKAAMFSPR